MAQLNYTGPGIVENVIPFERDEALAELVKELHKRFEAGAPGCWQTSMIEGKHALTWIPSTVVVRAVFDRTPPEGLREALEAL